MRNKLLEVLELKPVSVDVKNCTKEILTNITDLFIDSFNINDMYESYYGTIVLDYCNNGLSFTIEIGNNTFGYFSFGYFSKRSNEDIFEEEVFINEETINKLNSDFSWYINLKSSQM